MPGPSGASNAPPPSIKLCGIKEPASDNCTSPYGTQYQVLVQFNPGHRGTFQGLLDFIVSSKSAPSQDVTLSGTAGTGCLIITPQELDFGNVGIKSGNTYCKTNSRNFRALNTCDTPLFVTGLTNSGQSTDFRISSSPQLPFNAPGRPHLPLRGAVRADHRRGEVQLGQHRGPPSGGVANTYLAAFHGTASDTRQQVDTYIIPAQKVDILWIIGYANIYDIAYVLGLNPYELRASLGWLRA